MFGNAGRDHMEKYGSNPDHYAWIGWKNHKHSVNNPYAQFQDEYSLEDIKAAKMIHDPLTKLQCSPTSDGSACAIVASERYVDEHGLWDQAVEIVGQSMVTDLCSTFDDDADCMTIVGSDMSKTAADNAYEEAEVGAAEVDVCELHDCFSANELITYEALGFAAEGEAHKLVEAEATTYGGKVVVNPSGGLISKGHPLGATGLAQCSELTWQLRGEADKRQVDGREGRAPAQHRPRRRGRGHRLQAGRAEARREGGAADGEAAAFTERQGRGDHRRRSRDRQGDGDGAGARRAAGSRSATSTSTLAEQTATGLGGGTIALPLDVTDRASFAAFLDEAERQLGPLDVVVNNAGIMPVTPFVDESEESVQRQIDINLHGVITGTQLAIERMQPRDSGHIVNIASQAGKGGFPGIATYSATKHAVVGLSEAVRAELRGSGIEVSA